MAADAPEPQQQQEQQEPEVAAPTEQPEEQGGAFVGHQERILRPLAVLVLPACSPLWVFVPLQMAANARAVERGFCSGDFVQGQGACMTRSHCAALTSCALLACMPSEPALHSAAAGDQEGGEYRFLGQEEGRQAGDTQALVPATEEQAAATSAQREQQQQEGAEDGGGELQW